MLIRPRPARLLHNPKQMHHHPSQNTSISSHYIYITVPPPSSRNSTRNPITSMIQMVPCIGTPYRSHPPPLHLRLTAPYHRPRLAARARPASSTTPRLHRAGPARSRSTSTSSPATRSTTSCRTTTSPLWRRTEASRCPRRGSSRPRCPRRRCRRMDMGSRRGRRRGRSRGITGTAVGSRDSRAGKARRMGMGMGRHKGKGKARRSRGTRRSAARARPRGRSGGGPQGAVEAEAAR
ncbi:hypothetical protein DFH08DRAFT_896884 [Mycena albidolilacea]|uniref:Uncharacterized protein n=1 Tax=Mycena albidolilacea TaxID=1033008 RepID=A0AAD6Z8W3_9AGAR|nr:hypothetical protein DFH08DRAFT_896884 [Mycena albidolilacea]